MQSRYDASAMDHANTLIRRARPWLGTIVEIGITSKNTAPISEAAIDAGFAEIARIHQLMSFHDATSDLARLHGAGAGDVIRLDRDTVAVLRIAADLHRDTGGIFNIAVARQLVRNHFLPRMDVPHLNRFVGDMRDIEIVDDCHVRIRRCTLIDLGGIAKGYAVDCAVNALQAAGVMQGIVNAGGDLRVFGPAAMPINIRLAAGGYSAAFSAQNCAVASSENSRNRRMLQGRWVTPHIGRDGQPIIADQTVSVMASTCVIADAMTKVAMVDPDLADHVLAKHDGQLIRVGVKEVA
jgi:thiamine biosynthesis lipoprotein